MVATGTWGWSPERWQRTTATLIARDLLAQSLRASRQVRVSPVAIPRCADSVRPSTVDHHLKAVNCSLRQGRTTSPRESGRIHDPV